MAGKAVERTAEGAILGTKAVSDLTARGVTVEQSFEPNPMQLRMLQRLEFEVFAAGGKFGGKSFGAIFWMVKGNVELPDYDENGKPILVNMSYVHHPHFLGAVIRLNEKDLAEWVDKARPYYEQILGGTYTKNPSEFRWPSGARIFLGHAQDSNAWTKYAGQNITRFLIEEAGQIPDLDTYDQIRSCCRSVYPEMRAQILLTANPGGPGQQFLYDRFIEPKDREGVPIKHPEHDRPITDADRGLIRIKEESINPFTGDVIYTDRVWVPSYLSDNPHALKNTGYIATLATMSNEKLRRAYLLGDWKAMQGTYFDNFQRETHTYDPATRQLAPWWKATASLDWGFVHESAAYWHKKDPDTKQNLIYKEFVTSRTDPVELGAELARQSMEELRAQGSLIFYVSHDLYHERIGNFTWIELIGKGVQRQLGEGTCYMPEIVLKHVEERYRIEGKQWDQSIEDRILNKHITGIVFRRAPKAGPVGFMHVRSLMRMEPLIKTDEAKPDFELAQRIVAEGTLENYAAYLNSFKREVEILPELLISRACHRLIDAIPKPVHSEDNPDTVDDRHFIGKDSIDSCLVAGTMVRTINGESPIENVAVGDMVWTRDGYREVLASQMTSPAATVYEIESDSGDKLIGTGNHPVWTENRGFAPLDSLEYSDTILVWSKKRFSTETDIPEFQIPQGGICECTLSPRTKQPSGSGSQVASIGMSGFTISEKSQMDATSTTKTEIPSTTTSAISNALAPLNIDASTPAIWSDFGRWRKSEGNTQKSGTPLRKGLSGILKTPKRSTLNARFRNLSAAFAAIFTKLGIAAEMLTAPGRVLPKQGAGLGLMTYPELANAVGPFSSSTDSRQSELVPAHVKARRVLSEKKSVFNLAVAGKEEYLANGFLVHNCVYLLSGIRDERPSEMPRELDRLRQLDEARRRNPTLTTADMIWIARGIEDREAEADMENTGFCLGRAARGSRYRGTLQ